MESVDLTNRQVQPFASFIEQETMITEQEQKREYKTVSYLVSALSNMCAASPNVVIDRLTGLLWDEEEAGCIKRAFE